MIYLPNGGDLFGPGSRHVARTERKRSPANKLATDQRGRAYLNWAARCLESKRREGDTTARIKSNLVQHGERDVSRKSAKLSYERKSWPDRLASRLSISVFGGLPFVALPIGRPISS